MLRWDAWSEQELQCGYCGQQVPGITVAVLLHPGAASATHLLFSVIISRSPSVCTLQPKSLA